MIGEPQADLPDSWKVANMCEVVELNPRLDKSAYTGNPTVSFVPMPGVEQGTGAIDVSQTRSLEEVKKGYTPFRAGDVLFAKITPCMENGKMAVVPALKNGLGFGSTEFHVLRPYREISPRYIYHFISSESFRSDAERNMTGAVGQRRVPTSYLIDQSVPVPPVREQHRIVVKIEELLSELGKGVENLKSARAKLNVYRQSVLKHAFEGKLTAQWRDANKDKLEKPEQLLDRIKQERAAGYEGQLQEWKISLAQWHKSGQQGLKPKRPLKPKRLLPITSEHLAGLPPLPSGWRWVRIGEIGLVGTGVTPLKSKSKYYVDGCIAWVTSGALNDPFVCRPTGYVTEAAFNETNLRVYPPHTLVVALYGEGRTRGKCSELLIEATTNQAIAAIVQQGAAKDLRGLLKWFLTKNYQDVRTNASGGVQPNLNLGIIENSPVPLCSIAEAKAIEKLIKQKFTQADELEEVILARLRQADVLRQSILKKAFSGQLVAQDLNDEPASVLLKRIRAEREQAVKKNRSGNTRQRKASG